MRLFIGSSVSLARIHESGKIVPKTIGEMMRKPVFWIILLSIGAIAFCGATDGKVTLFLNGTVITVDETMTIAQAVAIKGPRIIAVGSNEEIIRHLTPNTEIVNLKGKTLMPGFVEVHSHPFLKMVVENATIDIRPAVGYTDGEEVMTII